MIRSAYADSQKRPYQEVFMADEQLVLLALPIGEVGEGFSIHLAVGDGDVISPSVFLHDGFHLRSDALHLLCAMIHGAASFLCFISPRFRSSSRTDTMLCTPGR